MEAFVQSGKMVSVNKAAWDIGMKTEEKLKYNRRWIKECKRVLKDDGTIWISGTMHNIYYVGVALELEGFSIINNVTWQKTNPPPNIPQGRLHTQPRLFFGLGKQLTPKKKANIYLIIKI